MRNNLEIALQNDNTRLHNRNRSNKMINTLYLMTMEVHNDKLACLLLAHHTAGLKDVFKRILLLGMRSTSYWHLKITSSGMTFT